MSSLLLKSLQRAFQIGGEEVHTTNVPQLVRQPTVVVRNVKMAVPCHRRRVSLLRVLVETRRNRNECERCPDRIQTQHFQHAVRGHKLALCLRRLFGLEERAGVDGSFHGQEALAGAADVAPGRGERQRGANLAQVLEEGQGIVHHLACPDHHRGGVAVLVLAAHKLQHAPQIVQYQQLGLAGAPLDELFESINGAILVHCLARRQRQPFE